METAYRLDLDEADWLRALAECAAATFGSPLGAFACAADGAVAFSPGFNPLCAARDLCVVDGDGLVIGVPWPRRISARQEALCARLGAYLRAAYRVRRRVVTPPQPQGQLSARELEVLGRAARGDRNKVIAFDLGLAHSTVRVLLHRAAAKLGARTRVDAIRRFAALAA